MNYWFEVIAIGAIFMIGVTMLAKSIDKLTATLDPQPRARNPEKSETPRWRGDVSCSVCERPQWKHTSCDHPGCPDGRE